jgi:hypothetical protein
MATGMQTHLDRETQDQDPETDKRRVPKLDGDDEPSSYGAENRICTV